MARSPSPAPRSRPCSRPNADERQSCRSDAMTAQVRRSPPAAARRLVRGDGATVWVQFDSVMVDGDSGESYVLTTMTDVSAQVEAQEALDRSDSWFRALLQHQSDIVTVVDFDGIIRYISPNCERLLGFRADEI